MQTITSDRIAPNSGISRPTFQLKSNSETKVGSGSWNKCRPWLFQSIASEVVMPKTRWMVPYGADQTLYLVVDRKGRFGNLHDETEIERSDVETIIAELMSGQFNEPARIIAYNTLEHWSQDVSRDIADEIQTRCDIEGRTIPEHIRDFVASCVAPARRSALQFA
jgi:hypothetical protein